MAASESNEKPTAADVEEVLAEFQRKVPDLKALCAKTKDLVEEFLLNADVPFQSVQARVKTKKKLRKKYLDPEKGYQRLGEITDLAGLRVITYYPDEVDQVARVIEQEFQIDRANSVDKRKIDVDRFGYSAINYVCEHLPARTALGEYKKFAGVRFELQVTSILSHAWSEMNHGSYDLGEDSPPDVQRRFFQLKALLELAESQFAELRDKTTNYARAVAIQVEAKVSDLALDPDSLRSLIDQEPLITQLDNTLAIILGVSVSPTTSPAALNLWARGARQIGLTKVQRLRDSLTQYSDGTVEFVQRCKEFWPKRAGSMSKGMSVFQLVKLLVRARGEEDVLRFSNALRLDLALNTNLVRQVEIAREIVAKFAKGSDRP